MTQTKPDTSRIWAEDSPQNIQDPDIQEAGKFSEGWIGEKPYYENMNYLMNLFTRSNAYINEQGIGSWDAVTIYPIGGVSKGADFKLYISVALQAGNNPVGDSGANWAQYLPTIGDITNLQTQITANTAGIATNTATIAADAQNIVDNLQLAVDARDLASDVRTDSIQNYNDIQALTVDTTAYTAIANAANQSLNSQNARISTNTADIASDASRISSNTSSSNLNTSSIAGLNSQYPTLKAQADQNASDILTHTHPPVTVPFASETVDGITSRATQGEVDAGANPYKYISPLRLSNKLDTMKSELSAATNGYWKDPTTGFIVQWGITGNIDNDSDAWVVAPMTYPHSMVICFSILGTITSTDRTGNPNTDPYLAVKKAGTTPFEYYTNALDGNNQIAWVAFGRYF